MSRDDPAFRSFRPDLVASFSSRPNRFVVEAESEGVSYAAHCPNPGRLREILVPGRRIVLEESPSPNRKTKWTLAAAAYSGRWIPLVSARSNALAGTLVLPRLYPDGKAAGERILGKSRIDWLVEDGGKRKWIEVKACTLVERGRALFPDAPSSRAVKHVGELSSLAGRDEGTVLITVMNPAASVFSPNPHTDPDFCLALAEASSRGVAIRALSIATDESGFSRIVDEALPVDLSSTSIASEDAGAIVRVWEAESSGNPEWRISIERCEARMTSALRRKPRPPAGWDGADGLHFGPSAALPVRGEIGKLSSLEADISRVNPGGSSRGPSWPVDPLTNAAFLDVVLEYRHERVFGKND